MKRTKHLLCLLTLAGAWCAWGAERDTPRAPYAEARLPAVTAIYTGQVVGQTNGLAAPYLAGSANLTVVGVAQNSAVSNGIVRVRAGIYGLKNFGDITAAHIGLNAYASTNDTAWTVGASGSAAVGKILAVDREFVWVRCGPQ